MTVDNYLAEAAALPGLAGIMAGFSLAAVVPLLTASIDGRLATAGIVIFSAASVMFLYALIVAILSLSAAAELARVPTELDNLNIGALLLMFGAIYVFWVVSAWQAGYVPELQVCLRASLPSSPPV